MAELFQVGARTGEAPITYRIGHQDKRVAIATVGGDGEIVGFLMPAQARELAASLIEMAGNLEGWEGEAGEAKRAAHVILPTIRLSLPGSGRY